MGNLSLWHLHPKPVRLLGISWAMPKPVIGNQVLGWEKIITKRVRARPFKESLESVQGQEQGDRLREHWCKFFWDRIKPWIMGQRTWASTSLPRPPVRLRGNYKKTVVGSGPDNFHSHTLLGKEHFLTLTHPPICHFRSQLSEAAKIYPLGGLTR